jgi:putative flippase GtrA
MEDIRSIHPRFRSRVRECLQALRAPDSGLLGQGARFVLVGCVVSAVYLLTTTILAVVVGMPFQGALAIGFCFAIVVHFTLHRVFVWVHRGEFALSFRHQIGRYLLVVCSQYGLTAASVSVLPSVLGLSMEIVYLVTALLIASANFLVLRNGVFHGTSAVED